MEALLRRHHIFSWKLRGHRALEDVDFDAPENIIYLPQTLKLAGRMRLSPHPGGHLDSYFDVEDVLAQLLATMNDRSLRSAEVKVLQDAMKIALANGDLYTNNPGTDVDADSINKKFYKNYKMQLILHPGEVERLRALRQVGIDTGNPHLEKLFAILDNPEREKILREVIANNPGVNITARNKDLRGTEWNSKFAVVDDDYNLPQSSPPNWSEVPSLPPFVPPSLRGLNEQEGLTRSDPRFSGRLPAFPELTQNEQRLGQLPPTSATPSDPLILKHDPMTGLPLPFYENQLAGGSSVSEDTLPWLATAATAGIAAPFLPAWLLLIGVGSLLFSRAANAQGTTSRTSSNVAADAGGVFSTGAPAYNRFDVGSSSGSANGNDNAPAISGSSSTEHASLGQNEGGVSTFTDRFGSWINSPRGSVPVQDPQVQLVNPTAKTIAPAVVRQLTRVNENNAGSAFASGTAPVPYLPSTEFNDRFGSWRMPPNAQHASNPASAFADEPSYLVPPPIFGSNESGTVAEEWLSRWVRPLLRSD